MKCIIRADSSDKMGSGHLMRCLTLAAELREVKKADILFICRDLPGNMAYLVEENGYDLCLLAYDESQYGFLNGLDEHKQWLGVTLNSDRDQTIAEIEKQGKYDLMVVDNYALDEAWETPMRQYVKKIMVIDDLADRKHDCDILLDHNFNGGKNSPYNHLVPESSLKLLGPSHALISRKFDEVKKERGRKEADNIFSKGLLYMGASDAQSKTISVLKNIRNLDVLEHLDVVVGSSNNKRFEIKKWCREHEKLRFHISPDYFHHLLVESDFCIGAVGVSQLERFFIGLPSITCIAANNQKQIAHLLYQNNSIKMLSDDMVIDCSNLYTLASLTPVNVSRLSVKDMFR